PRDTSRPGSEHAPADTDWSREPGGWPSHHSSRPPNGPDRQKASPRSLTIMTPMSGALDWLAVGDVAEERTADGLAILGGGAARLAAHAAGLGARAALVAKLGEDDAARRVRDALERLKVELQWLRTVPGMRTTIWHQPD